MKYVYIPIELSQRELMPALFYASLFADETTTVILVNNWYFTQLLQVKALPPGLVIDKDLSHRGYFQRFKSAKQQGFVIASKIIEDLDIGQDWHSSLYSDARSVDVLDFYLAGFQEDENKVKRAFSRRFSETSARKVIRFPEPRFYLLRDEFKCCFQRRIDAFKELYGNFTLLTLSERPSLEKSREEQVHKRYKHFFKGSLLTEVEISYFANKVLAISNLLSDHNSKIIDKIRSTEFNGDTNLVIRPHPTLRHTGLDTLSKLFTNKGTEISLVGSFEEVFHASSKQITGPCTTYLASLFAENSKSTLINLDNPSDRRYRISSSISPNQSIDIAADYSGVQRLREVIPTLSKPVQHLSSLTHKMPISPKFTAFKSSDKNKFHELLCHMFNAQNQIGLLNQSPRRFQVQHLAHDICIIGAS